jgi:hypothetical protein
MPLMRMTYFSTEARWSGGFQWSRTPSALMPASDTSGATGTSRPSTCTSLSRGCESTWYARKATLQAIQCCSREVFLTSACVPEQGIGDAGGAQPARRGKKKRLHVVVGDGGRPVERRQGLGRHGGGLQMSRPVVQVI